MMSADSIMLQTYKDDNTRLEEEKQQLLERAAEDRKKIDEQARRIDELIREIASINDMKSCAIDVREENNRLRAEIDKLTSVCNDLSGQLLKAEKTIVRLEKETKQQIIMNVGQVITEKVDNVNATVVTADTIHAEKITARDVRAEQVHVHVGGSFEDRLRTRFAEGKKSDRMCMTDVVNIWWKEIGYSGKPEKRNLRDLFANAIIDIKKICPCIEVKDTTVICLKSRS